MLTLQGCRDRRRRLLERLAERVPATGLVLADPLHLMYLAGLHVDPFSLGGDSGAILVIQRDGRATLYHENRLPKSADAAHVDERRVINWYEGQAPALCTRRLVPHKYGTSAPIHDRPETPFGEELINLIATLRRTKDPDELVLMARCMRATDAGHQWARQNIRAGMTELDVYRGVASTCMAAAGQAVIVYGDFAVSPGPERRGGPPTDRVLAPGDMFILDYSVVICGYRSDFTNTLVIDKTPSADQQRLYDLCKAAMSAGEEELRAGASCLTVYSAVRDAFARHGMADAFPHHAGHGLGLSHPEAPYIVRSATETLMENDVVTLEPGLYVSGVGGIRIEHNYRVTRNGFERMSQHEIALK